MLVNAEEWQDAVLECDFSREEMVHHFPLDISVTQPRDLRPMLLGVF